MVDKKQSQSEQSDRSSCSRADQPLKLPQRPAAPEDYEISLKGCYIGSAKQHSRNSTRSLNSAFLSEGSSELGRRSAPAQLSISPQTGRNVLDVKTSSASIHRLNKDKARAFLYDYYDDFESICQQTRDLSASCIYDTWMCFFEEYFSPRFQIVRPSGNPLPYEGFTQIWASGDIRPKEIKLVSVDDIIILAGGLSAVATITSDEKFFFKGKPVEDRAVTTCVLEMSDAVTGSIRFVHQHRCSGRPIPKESRWTAGDE